MKKAQEEGLFFSLPVDEMLQINTAMISNFKVDKDVLIADVSALKDPFLNEWMLQTSELKSIESDNDYIDTQLLMTQSVEKLMEKGRDLIQSIYIFLDLAFPGDKVIQSFFGKDTYEKARNTPIKMQNLLKKVHGSSINPAYKEQLMAKGLKQTMIDEIATTKVELEFKYDERDLYIRNRKLLTQQRKNLLNAIWKSMSIVNEASKLVYKNDYAKQQQYLLYYAKSKPTDSGTKASATA